MSQAPRWRLATKHYLNVPGTEWEHREISQAGKPINKRYTVPRFLSPEDPDDFNYPGEIIVCRIDNDSMIALPNDIIFVGPPTPDMVPLNDAAQAISAAFAPSWNHPIESLPGQGFADGLLAQLTKQLDAIITRQGIPNASVASTAEFDALKAQMQALMEANAKLQAQVQALATQSETEPEVVAPAPVPTPSGAQPRRV